MRATRRARCARSGARPHLRPTRASPVPTLAANFVPGCYALRVKGVLPNQHQITIEDAGIRYKSLEDDNS